MSDFVSNELIEIDVNGRIFKIRELTGVEVDEILDNALSYDAEEKKTVVSITKQNEGYLKSVIEAPYDEWKTLKSEDRIQFLNKLKSSIRSDLITKIKNYHNDFGDAIKK